MCKIIYEMSKRLFLLCGSVIVNEGMTDNLYTYILLHETK